MPTKTIVIGDYKQKKYKFFVPFGKTRIYFTEEGWQQYQLANWLRDNNITFIHVPNEGHRTNLQGIMLKLIGLEAGVADFLIFDIPPNGKFHGIAIEMKANKNKKCTEAQIKWLQQIEKCGWITKIAYSANEAIRFLIDLFGKGTFKEIKNETQNNKTKNENIN